MIKWTEQQLLRAQQDMFEKIAAHEGDLAAIRSSSLPLVERWQQFLQLILPIQLEVLAQLGMPKEQSSLSSFNKQYMEKAAGSPLLFEANRRKWLFLFEKAFGVRTLREITLEMAHQLTFAIVKAMTSEEFLLQVDEMAKQFPEDISLVTRRQRLLNILLPLHMSVMAEQGFAGETGYLEVQRALMEYYYDPIIIAEATKAQRALFSRAGLL